MLLKTTRSIPLDDELVLPRASSPKQRALAAVMIAATSMSFGLHTARIHVAKAIMPATAGHPLSVWDDFSDEDDG